MEQDLHNAQHHKTMDLNKEQFVVQATIWKKKSQVGVMAWIFLFY